MNKEKPTIKAYAVLAAVFIFIGLGMYIFFDFVTGLCIPLVTHNASLLTIYKDCSDTVTAEVTNVDTIYNSTTRKAHKVTTIGYKATFSFEYNGKQYTQRSIDTISDKLYEVGDTVELRIDPNDMTRFYDPRIYEFPVKGAVIRVTAVILYLIAFIALIRFAVKKAKEKLKEEQQDV